MKEEKIYTVIGLMSGTSLDGVDCALIRTDGLNHIERLDFATYPYDKDVKNAVRAVFGARSVTDDTIKVEQIITEAHVQALHSFGHKADVIGFHGQTISHDPAVRFTWQIGDGQALANAVNMDVVCDMRKADVMAGGEGAPLLPLYHRALASSLPGPLAILNLGGVGNVTWLGRGSDDILAFDTGPANALIDDFVQARTGRSFDENGLLAAAGEVDRDLVDEWLAHPYFSRMPPKSLDRNAWNTNKINDLKTEDGVATLTSFTIQSVAKSIDFLPEKPVRWLVTGGGRKNKFIMQGLQDALGVSVEPVEQAGWNGDAMEAEGFAYLAVRSLKSLPLTLPGTTGVERPLTGGVLYKHDDH